jgi:serine/threonine protein kinase/Flp pilus assembly protein TadD
MTPERWKQIDEIAQATLERGVHERVSFLDEACLGDDALRLEVESQIAYQQQASKFLEEPAFQQHLGAQASLPALLIADPQTEIESMEVRTISHYRILRKLGAGGMGDVYLALDTTLSRKVAIKFLSQNSVAGEHAKKRLAREAKAAAALDHPHICAVYEVGEEAGYSFIVMQYVEGETLASRIQRQPIESREALDIAVQIADALAEAHSHRIIHRDVKPQNVMLTASGQVKVLDFGLARVVRDGSLIDSASETESMPGLVIGTVPYMSPEQVRGEDLDGRSDIFSFGAVLYEMLSGRNPFQGESVGATMSSILTKEPPPLARFAADVPDELQRMVRKALSKDKEARYQGIKDLLIDLRELKQELEFEAKLERSTGPESQDRSTTPERAETGGRPDTTLQQTVHTDESIVTRKTSSSMVVIGEIKRHKLGALLTLAVIVVAAVSAYFYFHRQPVLTDKDTILLADFVNRTGDDVFDDALKQALAIQLEQSPFFNIFPEDRIRETLRFMSRSPDERVTKDVAREICERRGIKAMLFGSIAPIGSHYVISLEATNGHTGGVIARQQVEAESKEKVLETLGRATTKLREKLGESLSSIEKYDAPITEATTSSLEALKAYSLGVAQNRKGKFIEAISSLKRAIMLDPNFAVAYSGLAINYYQNLQDELAAESAQKAFDLRDRVSEREKLIIADAYYRLVTRENDKEIETLEVYRLVYPRGYAQRNNLGWDYIRFGQYQKAIEELREASRIAPDAVLPYQGLGVAFTRLDRFDEARDYYNQSLTQNPDWPACHRYLYGIGFVQSDSPLMKQQLDWASGRADEYVALSWQAQTSAFSGRWREASGFSRRASDLAEGHDKKQPAAQFAAEAALVAATFDHCQQARADVSKALALARNVDSIFAAACALALCGEVGQAESLAGELSARYPKGTYINAINLPVIRAVIALKRRNPDQAIQLLQKANSYNGGTGGFWPAYLRGQAYLMKRVGTEAAAEFQKILDHRGWDATSPLFPLAHLGLARAAALTGDAAKARKTYQDFFALWKDADADLPMLIEAKKEYAALK